MQLRSHELLELGSSPGRLNSCGSNGGRNGPLRIDISVIIKGGNWLLAAASIWFFCLVDEDEICFIELKLLRFNLDRSTLVTDLSSFHGIACSGIYLVRRNLMR